MVPHSTYSCALQKKKARTSISAVSCKNQNLSPNKLKNIDRRKREHLTSAEVKYLREAAKAYGSYGDLNSYALFGQVEKGFISS